jgi:probable F420-dependent oxidoreductase
MELGLCTAPLGGFADMTPAGRRAASAPASGVPAGASAGPVPAALDVAALAVEAERRGYHELWAIDRLLDPVAPRSQYPVSADGRIPAEQRVSLDPVVALAVIAARTSRIRIGTNVLVAPWYRPALLARSLASLDAVSGGRLDVGLGLGWSADEYAAVGVPQRQLADRQVDVIAALEALWRPGPVAYRGRDFEVAPTDMAPKPSQRPRPPILLAAYTEAGLRRAGRLADGWTPSGLDLPTTAAMWAMVLAAAEDAGRDPAALSLVVHAGVHHATGPLGASRPTYHGSIGQIAEDVRGAFAIGARQVILYPEGTRSLAEYFDVVDALASAADIPLGGLTRAAS